MTQTIVGPGFSPASRAKQGFSAAADVSERLTAPVREDPASDAWRERLFAVTIATLLSLVSIWIVFRPLSDWTAYPLAYTNTDDGLFNLYVIKAVLETGWYGSNPALGAPFGSEPFDFAKPETLHLMFYKVAGLFTGNIALIHNLFYFAGFLLVAWSALFVLRSPLGLSWPLAIAGGQIYSWLPYHFARIEHLFLSNYYVVPIGVWLILRACSDRPPFFERGRSGLAGPWVWLSIALVASTSLYYGFFTLVLLIGVALFESIAARSWRVLTSALLIAVFLCGAIAVNLAPSLAYRAREGANLVTAARTVNEADLYALKPLQLLLPFEGHRLDVMGRAARTYNEPRNENRYAALGLVGAFGFVLLLLHVMTGDRVLPQTRAVASLTRANLLAVVLGMVGGLGTLVALFGTPQFRALNRISVFIGFFCIAVALTLVDRALRYVGQGFPPSLKLRRTRRSLGGGGSPATLIATSVIMLVAFFDQVPAAARPDVQAIARSYDSDRAFVARIERMLPPGALVYQMPHTMFPEVRPLHREPSYSPMRLYVHSSTVRSSHGGIKGRAGDNWHVLLAQAPLRNRIATLQAAGFSGVVVDRRALPDGGRETEQELKDVGLEGPVDSTDRTLAFYRMPKRPADDADILLLGVGGRGFYPVEGTYPAHWLWSNGAGELRIFNPLSAARNGKVSFSISSLLPRSVQLRWPGGRAQALLVTGEPTPVSADVLLRPGWDAIGVTMDTPAVLPHGTGDRRILAVKIGGFSATAR
jgi:phosphoglycerol transferase